MPFSFVLEKRDSGARAARFSTDHGEVLTPVFMPVATQASVKALTPRDLLEIKAQIILVNAYHIFLRPGLEVISEAGGVHAFMNWAKPILTDSGGFQVLSLADLRRVNGEGIIFRSHINGEEHLFTPESVIEAQKTIGADIIMSFDYCSSYPCSIAEARKAVELTVAWARRGAKLYGVRFDSSGYEQVIFGIVQGSVNKDLRIQCTNMLMEMDFPGFAIGGLSVGENKEEMWGIVEALKEVLPEDRPRYLMGVGTPLDLVEAISRGMDMFDCVMPTRNARNGTVFSRNGKMVLKNAVYAKDFSPIDDQCTCYTCSNFSRAYLRHLFVSGEITAPVLATLHSIHFYCGLMSEAREAILRGCFLDWKKHFIDCYTCR